MRGRRIPVAVVAAASPARGDTDIAADSHIGCEEVEALGAQEPGGAGTVRAKLGLERLDQRRLAAAVLPDEERDGLSEGELADVGDRREAEPMTVVGTP
jgi:hypothetical protein